MINVDIFILDKLLIKPVHVLNDLRSKYTCITIAVLIQMAILIKLQGSFSIFFKINFIGVDTIDTIKLEVSETRRRIFVI